MGETLPSIVTVWTANQYSPSCDDRNVNVGWSGNVLLLDRQWYPWSSEYKQMQLLDPVPALGIQIERDSKVTPLVVDRAGAGGFGTNPARPEATVGETAATDAMSMLSLRTRAAKLGLESIQAHSSPLRPHVIRLPALSA